jgi:putative transposase
VQELRQRFSLAGLLKLAGLSRSTFYYRLQALQTSDRHAGLKAQIREVFDRHKGRYGYRRVTHEIRRNCGMPVNHKTVQRLMTAQGLKSLVRPKRYRAYRGDVGQAAPNVLQRQFEARQIHQKWVTDVTEFNIAGQKLYLSPVLDLYNGEVIAFHTARQARYELVHTMLEKAMKKLRDGDKPILHSDQGWQYRMSAYQHKLQQHGLQQSMSRKGNCLDNAAMESFFATLKSEFFYLEKPSTIEDLENGLEQYIHYYNNIRIKSKLNGLSPVQYRTQPQTQ